MFDMKGAPFGTSSRLPSSMRAAQPNLLTVAELQAVHIRAEGSDGITALRVTLAHASAALYNKVAAHKTPLLQ